MASEPLVLQDFEIGGPLGKGATSRVFAATHLATGREVAIKMLEPAHRNSDELRERLHREARMLAGVESRFVGRILGLGYEDDQPFLVLEQLRGETLADYLKREKRVEVESLALWMEQLLIGVRDCHTAGVIHRDIKPANIYLAEDEASEQINVKLIDFGIARLKEIANMGRSLTSTHHVLGSMGYMAPEQFQYAKGVGVQADLYAIGVLIFRCVAGRLPLVSRSVERLISMKLEGAPLVSSLPGVTANDELDAFLVTALQPNPSSRFDSAGQMLEAWWRVAASLDRNAPLAEGVDVVFDDDEGLGVSTDVIAGGAARLTNETLNENESTTITGRQRDREGRHEEDDPPELVPERGAARGQRS